MLTKTKNIRKKIKKKFSPKTANTTPKHIAQGKQRPKFETNPCIRFRDNSATDGRTRQKPHTMTCLDRVKLKMWSLYTGGLYMQVQQHGKYILGICQMWSYKQVVFIYKWSLEQMWLFIEPAIYIGYYHVWQCGLTAEQCTPPGLANFRQVIIKKATFFNYFQHFYWTKN